MVIIQKTAIPPPSLPNRTRPTLTEEEQKKYETVLVHFTDAEFVLPGVDDGKHVLVEEEKFWLTRECLLRYLRASKWNEKDAIRRLEETLKWRHEFGYFNDEMTPSGVENEGLTGKELVFGYDVAGRPAVYMLPSRQNTDGSTTEGQRKQLQYAIFMLERAFDLMGPGIENLALMIDFSDRGKNPSFGTARLMLSYLQDHFPERLGLALVANLPWAVTLFFKAVTPFIDPVTRTKLKFNPNVVPEGLFEASQVTTKWGGDVEIPWEQATYWPALMKLCAERREQQLNKWRELGGHVGISEWDIRQEPAATHDEKKPSVDEKAESVTGAAPTVELVAAA
ncbi:hypothetical protein FRB90_006735 [Tulasnella sp. 427]|nr:hypothetical protein FRB90_006735 [Tulasnella sp. 427]